MNDGKNSKNGRYQVVKQLGKGSFGVVYLVKEIQENGSKRSKSDKGRGLNKENLFVMKSVELTNDQELEEVIKEVESLSKLRSDYVIKLQDYFLSNDFQTSCLNIVCEYAEQGDLRKHIESNLQRRKYFNENLILKWFSQICLGLKEIHSKKMIHRDLKSQNIFLTSNGDIKIGDLGFAKVFDYTLQKAQTTIGTPYYLSPEICMGKPYSYKSDIWSLGVLLYEMCMCRLPFKEDSLVNLMKKIIQADFAPMSKKFSPEIRSLVDCLLQVDCNSRLGLEDIFSVGIIKNRIASGSTELRSAESKIKSDIMKSKSKDDSETRENTENVKLDYKNFYLIDKKESKQIIIPKVSNTADNFQQRSLKIECLDKKNKCGSSS